MNHATPDRIEAYLDGLLDLEQTRCFEQDLLAEDVAAEFREYLLLRDLLGHLPPEQPPPGLMERIESAMIDNAAIRPREPKALPGQRFGWLAAGARAGWGWTGYALSGLTSGSGALKESMGGMKTIGYSLGPLRSAARKEMQAVKSESKALWKKAMSGVWRGLSS